MTVGPFLTERGEPRAFVIVTSARSGSNLLVTYLRQLTRAACFGEILRDRFPETPGWDRLVQRLGMPPDARRLHAEDVTGFWELFLAQGLRRRRWVGAKVFYYHRREDPVWDRFADTDHRVLHLWRDATFDQYVSRLLAFETGEWKGAGRSGAAEPSTVVESASALSAAALSAAALSAASTSSAAASTPSPSTSAASTSSASSREPRVTFDREDYLAYREVLRADIEATRARYGGSERYVELEYRQLSDHDFVIELLMRLFGERVDVREGLRRQRARPKIEYLLNPAVAEPFTADSIADGFADA